MFRKIAAMIMMITFLIAGTAFGMTKSDKSGTRATAGMAGKVTAVKGTTVTVKDAKGIERQFDVNSTAGLKVGQSAWCEEDCGKGMRIGEKNVQVKGIR